MNKNFVRYMVDVIEGGLVNDKDDTGGITNHGITKPFLAMIENRSVSSITDSEIINLDKPKSYAVYEQYWKICMVDLLPEVYQDMYFDMCVNHGIGNAAKILQRSVAPYVSVYIDGRLGPQTVAAAKEAADKFPRDQLLKKFVEKRIDFYKAIVEARPKQVKFINGWTKRANWFLTEKI